MFSQQITETKNVALRALCVPVSIELEWLNELCVVWWCDQYGKPKGSAQASVPATNWCDEQMEVDQH